MARCSQVRRCFVAASCCIPSCGVGSAGFRCALLWRGSAGQSFVTAQFCGTMSRFGVSWHGDVTLRGGHVKCCFAKLRHHSVLFCEVMRRCGKPGRAEAKLRSRLAKQDKATARQDKAIKSKAKAERRKVRLRLSQAQQSGVAV